MAAITKDMVISDIIAIDRGVIPFFLQLGMHCVGCPSAQGETLAEAGLVHGIEVDQLVDEINKYLEKAG